MEAENRSKELASKPSQDEIKNLITKSQDVKSKAYAPYSSFKVGAALLTDNGTVFTGEIQGYGSGSFYSQPDNIIHACDKQHRIIIEFQDLTHFVYLFQWFLGL